MNIVLSWLWGHKEQVGIALLAGIVLLVLKSLHSKNMELSEIRGRLEQKVEQCRVIEEEHARARAEWDAKIAEAEQRRVESEKEVGRIRTVHEEKVREVLTAPIAQGCEGAIGFLKSKAKEFGTWQIEGP